MLDQRSSTPEGHVTGPDDSVGSGQQRSEVHSARERRLVSRHDRLFGSDPGLMRLTAASQAVLSIGLALAFGALFVHLTGALQVGLPAGHVPAAATAVINQQRRGAFLTGMLLSASMAIAISLTSGTDRSLRREVVTALLMPVAMFAVIAACLPFASHRVLMFVLLALFAGIGMYLKRYGARLAVLGLFLWAGAFAAFFVHGDVSESQLGWVAAELAIGTLVSVLVRVTIFRPRWRLEFRLTGRSMVARERRALRRAADHVERPTRRTRPDSETGLLRLNETALMIDSRTAGIRGRHLKLGARTAHASYLADLSISHLVDIVLASPVGDLPADVRSSIVGALRALADDEPDRAAALLGSLDAGALRPSSRAVVNRITAAAQRVVEDRHSVGSRSAPVSAPSPSTPLIAGWLPGTMMVSARASMQPGHKRLDRVAVLPPLRSAIQLVIAMGLAIAAGDSIDGGQFYWAMLAVFVAFMGGSNSYETIRRSIARVSGTTIGIFLGFFAVDLIGDRGGWQIALVLVALFFGFYLNRVNYFFFVLGITVMVSQIYEHLGEYSHHFLYVRLEETAAGSAIAIAVMLLILPLRRSRVFTVALGTYLEGLETFLRSVAEHPVDEATPLRAEVRRIDASYQTLAALCPPLPIRRFDPAAAKRANVLVDCGRARSAARAWSQDLKGAVGSAPPARGIQDRISTEADELRAIRAGIAGGRQIDRRPPRPRVAAVPFGRSEPPRAEEYLAIIGASARELAAEFRTTHRTRPVAEPQPTV